MKPGIVHTQKRSIDLQIWILQYCDLLTITRNYLYIMKIAWFSWGLSWSWSYGSWIYNYLCNQCLSPLTWVQIPLRRGVLDTTLCDKDCQQLAARRWISPGTPVSSTNKTDHDDIAEILLKVVLNTITLVFLMLNNRNCHKSSCNCSYLWNNVLILKNKNDIVRM